MRALSLGAGFELHPENIRDVIGSEQSGQRDDPFHYLQVVFLVLAIYDHMLTFDLELLYVWSREWSVSAVLYILTRYGGNLTMVGAGVVLLNQHSTPPFCNIGIKVVGCVSTLVILISQVVMQLRIKAMYRNEMTLLINVFFGIEIIVAAAIGVGATFVVEVKALARDSMQICTVTKFPSFASAFWLPILLFESFLFLLAFRVAWYNHQQVGRWSGATLLHTIVCDNFGLFVIAFISYALTGIIWLVAKPQYALVPAMISCSLAIIRSCRVGLY